MNMPRFAAEASLYPVNERRLYVATKVWRSNGQIVVPQTTDLTFPGLEMPHGRICRWKCYAEAGGIVTCQRVCY